MIPVTVPDILSMVYGMYVVVSYPHERSQTTFIQDCALLSMSRKLF